MPETTNQFIAVVADVFVPLVIAIVAGGWVLHKHFSQKKGTTGENNSGCSVGGDNSGNLASGDNPGNTVGNNNSGTVIQVGHVHYSFDIGKTLETLMREEQGRTEQEISGLKERLTRAGDELQTLRKEQPDWKEQINGIIAGFNKGEADVAKEAFRDLNRLMDKRSGEIKLARALDAEATLLYPFNYKEALPLQRSRLYVQGEGMLTKNNAPPAEAV